jgi:hypothetical protein
MCGISATLLTLLILFGAFVGTGHSQSIVADQKSLQEQIDDLRNDLDNLKKVVRTLQKATKKTDVTSQKTTQEKISRPAKQDIDNLSVPEQGKIKAEVCEAVGQFFVQVDKALKMPDSSEAKVLMEKAGAQLESTVGKYGQGKKLNSVISLAEDLAYEIYQSSRSGNADFIKNLPEYKDRYKKTCGTRWGLH